MRKRDTSDAEPVEAQVGKLPVRLTRREAAELVKKLHGLEVSPRSLEAWPLPIQRVMGRAYIPTADLLAEVARRLAAAPVMAAGRRRRG